MQGRTPTLRTVVTAAAALWAAVCSAQTDDPHARRAGDAGQQVHAEVPPPSPAGAKAPEGYGVEVVVSGLTFPTSVEFDGAGNLYIAEAGFSYNDVKTLPRVLRVDPDGNLRVVASRGLVAPVTDLLWHDGRMYVSHRGKISVLEEGGSVRDLVTELPSRGDHHSNQITAGPDGKIYFGQGVATNSGVVGVDNVRYWPDRGQGISDTSPFDIRVTGEVFTTPDAADGGLEKVKTTAFQPFGTSRTGGAVIKGQVKAGGTILRMDPDGANLEVYAWGLRNPFGLMWAPDGKLYCTENGMDERGSRPVADDPEDLYVIKQGAWYGWPDFCSGKPVTDPKFRSPRGAPPEFLMVEHPAVETPLFTFPTHSSICKIDVAPAGPFGHEGEIFIAFFGHMAPQTGVVTKHGGHRVARFDPAHPTDETFFGKKEEHSESGGGHKEADQGGHGQQPPERGGKPDYADDGGKHDSGAHGHAPGEDGKEKESGTGKTHEGAGPGPRRPVDVRFSPAGDALYIADHGAMLMDSGRPDPIPRTGVVWRVVRTGTRVQPPANLTAPVEPHR